MNVSGNDRNNTASLAGMKVGVPGGDQGGCCWRSPGRKVVGSGRQTALRAASRADTAQRHWSRLTDTQKTQEAHHMGGGGHVTNQLISDATHPGVVGLNSAAASDQWISSSTRMEDGSTSAGWAGGAQRAECVVGRGSGCCRRALVGSHSLASYPHHLHSSSLWLLLWTVERLERFVAARLDWGKAVCVRYICVFRSKHY